MGIKQRDKAEWVVGKVLAEQAARRGEQPFVRIGDGPWLTYGEADAMANRAANGFAGMGMAQGDHVGVMLPNSLDYVHTWFGLSRLGAVHVAINTAYKGVFLEHVLNNCGAQVMVIARDYLGWLHEIEARVPALQTVLVPGLAAGEDGLPAFQRIETRPFESVLEAPADAPQIEVNHWDIGAIMYTSGTTGPSKGVLMPHAHLYMLGWGTVENLSLSEQDLYYIAMPLFHANAMLMQFYGTMQAGGRCMVAPAFSASGWLDDVRRSGATLTNLLGVMNEFVVRQPERPEDKDHKLRLILSIPSAPEVVTLWRERFGVQIVEAYGMTEVNIPLYHPPHREPVAGSCGLPYAPYYEVRVVNPTTDEELPPGEVGEIVVRPNEPYAFMQGYNAMQEKTVETWRNLWFHTGDAARRDEQGYFYYMDRINDRIRRRGENISSYEIEQVIGAHPAVADVAAIAVKSDIRGGEDEIKACVVLKPQCQATPEELLDLCQKNMPYFSVPRYVEFYPILPKTPTEKIQTTKLREHGISPNTCDAEAAGYVVKRT
ncbi:MAG: AMP-binding protein [SAR324 cluster bacterium]|nr:AMP-binding protein [SAR324 cluster bacterium]